jgi:RNA polymerase sigma-70 factor (ECF subfamily)
VSGSSFGMLRDYLVGRYDDLKRRLTLQLGSADLAGDALQDTWLRLQAGSAEAQDPREPVQYPLSYLMRMATNVALDRIRAEARFMNGEEVEQLFAELGDPAPDPAQQALGRSELAQLAAIIEEMPPRRRHVLILVRVDEMPRQEVADRLGVSLSLVDRELRRAHEYIVERTR